MTNNNIYTLLKKIAKQTVKDVGLKLQIGEVKSVGPLKVTIDNRLELDEEDMLILSGTTYYEGDMVALIVDDQIYLLLGGVDNADNT